MTDVNIDEQSIMDYITEIELIYSMQEMDQENDNDDDNDITIGGNNNSINETGLDVVEREIDRAMDRNETDITDAESRNTFYNLIRMYNRQNNRVYRNFSSIDNDITQVTDTWLLQFQDALENEVMNQTIEASLQQSQPIEKRILSDKGKISIETYRFKSYKDCNYHKFTSYQCPISLEPFQENDLISKLPCGHEFLQENIMLWLETESVKCPVCRYELEYKSIYVQSKE